MEFCNECKRGTGAKSSGTNGKKGDGIFPPILKSIDQWLSIGGFVVAATGAVEAVLGIILRLGLLNSGTIFRWSFKPVLADLTGFVSPILFGLSCMGLGEIIRLLRKNGVPIQVKHDNRLDSKIRAALIGAPMLCVIAGWLAGVKSFGVEMANPAEGFSTSGAMVKAVFSGASTWAWSLGICLAVVEMVYRLGTDQPDCPLRPLKSPICAPAEADSWLKLVATLYLIASVISFPVLVWNVRFLPSSVDRGLIGILTIIASIRTTGKALLLIGLLGLLDTLRRGRFINIKEEKIALYGPGN